MVPGENESNTCGCEYVPERLPPAFNTCSDLEHCRSEGIHQTPVFTDIEGDFSSGSPFFGVLPK